MRIEAGHIDYVNEIRRCTVLFLGFPSLNNRAPDASQTREQAAQAKVHFNHDMMIAWLTIRPFDVVQIPLKPDILLAAYKSATGSGGRSKKDASARWQPSSVPM